MSNLFESYRMVDGKTPLAAGYFNPNWISIDSRIGSLEAVSSQLETSIAQLTEEGLEAIQDRVFPVIDDAEALLAAAEAQLATLDNPADSADLNAYTGRHIGAVFTYDGSDRVSTVTETIDIGGGQTAEMVSAFTYDGSDRISTIETTWNGIVRTETMNYDGSDRVASVSVQEVPE